MTRKAEPPSERGYHHGDLRAALLRAAEEELMEKGIEGFTLRSCARRAGVSPAAPSHHFGDVTGLLTEVAIEAFGGLAASMRREMAVTERGSIEHVIAAAIGYVDFSLDRPAQFKLMFRSERLHAEDTALRMASAASSSLAADSVGAFVGSQNPMGEPAVTRKVVGLWSLAHGVASLLLAGQLGPTASGRAIARALVPDLVRSLFGVSPENRKRDLDLIKRTSAAAS
jgi:AcrR family transcriptional regulator